MLTKGQQVALDAVRQGKNVFLTGGGGVGKSYLVHQMVVELQTAGKTVLVTASTGKAATLIGGVTCHHTFRIPIKGTWLEEPKIHEDSPLYEADAILIDEVSMLRIDAFEYIIKSVEEVNRLRTTDEYLKNPENVHRSPIQIIVVGDFCQLPPVIFHPKDGSPDEGELMSDHYGFDVGQGYAFLAPGWSRSHFITCELTEMVRQSDTDMINALNRLRFGDRTALDYFKEHKRKEKFPKTDEDVVYLCGKNKTADRINDTSLSHLPGCTSKFYAYQSGAVKDQDKQAPELIKLKVGARVIMLQNADKYRNGDVGTVTEIYADSVSVRIHETGEEVEIPYATWDIERYVIKADDGKKKVEKEKIGSYSQLPLRLGYAITIHKSQGQTFEKAVLCLGSDDKKKGAKSTRPEIFAYGQLYVSLSRVRSMSGLYIEGNLDLVDKLTAPEVIEFYGISGLPQKISCATQDIESPKKTKKTTAKTSGKAAKKNPLAIEKKILSPGLSVLHCTEKNVSIAWIFAHTLSPDAVLSGTDILIPEKYCKEAERFINALA